MWKVKMTPAFRALARERLTLASQDALVARLSTNPQIGDFLGNFNDVDVRQFRWSKFMIVFEVDEPRKTVRLTTLVPWSPDLSAGIDFLRLVKKIILGFFAAKKFMDAARELAERYGIDIDFPDSEDDNENRMQAYQSPRLDSPFLNILPPVTDIGAVSSQVIQCEIGLGKTAILGDLLKAVKSQHTVVPESGNSSINRNQAYEANYVVIAPYGAPYSELGFDWKIKSVVTYDVGNSGTNFVRSTTTLVPYLKEHLWNNFGRTMFTLQNEQVPTKRDNYLPMDCFFGDYLGLYYSYSAQHFCLWHEVESSSDVGLSAFDFHATKSSKSIRTLKTQSSTRCAP